MHCFLSFVLFLRWCFHARLLLEPCWTLPCLCRLWSLNERRFCTASFRHPLWIVGGFCRLARQWPSRQTSYLLHFYIVHEAQREGFHGKSLVFSWSFVLRSMIPPWHLSCTESSDDINKYSNQTLCIYLLVSDWGWGIVWSQMNSLSSSNLQLIHINHINNNKLQIGTELLSPKLLSRTSCRGPLC